MESTESAIVMSTYHRTIEGDGFETICSFQDQSFDNFYLLFDNKIDKTEQEISKSYRNINVCSYTEKDFALHNFNRPIDRRHRWGSHQNPNYFYAHFRMLLFWKKHPQYKYYWFFDDDVTFTGNLKQLLQVHDANQSSDFLAIQVFKKESYDEQFPHINITNDRMGSNGHWLSFAPGPGDCYKSVHKHMGSFFPIVRFTNRSLEYLYNLNEKNFFGYSEGFVPTTLASDNFSVASMLDENDQYFIDTEQCNCELFHKGSEFTWTWI